METAKVDMRRLQLLNDRIAQVMEALNQVRFSVHGLQHTAQFSPWAQQYGHPYAGQVGLDPRTLSTLGVQQGLGFTPGLNVPYQQNWVNPMLGLSHSPFEAIDPTAAYRFGIDPLASARIGLDPITGARIGIDPFTNARVAQTFPFAYSAVAPI